MPFGNLSDYLIFCKEKEQEGELEVLGGGDESERKFKVSAKPQKSTLQEILVKQYVKNMLDKRTNHSFFKEGNKYSAPVIFAMMSKAIKQGNLTAAHSLMSYLKDNLTTNIQNKHVLQFNISKIYSFQGNLHKATFYIQNLLKKTGSGLDYYTYQLLVLLISQNRHQQALKIAYRHLQNINEKHKIQSAFIYLLDIILDKDDVEIVKKVDRYFNGRTICLRNYYNIAQLMKHRCPDRALDMFRKILMFTNHDELKKIEILTKINILEIYEKYYIYNSDVQMPKSKMKQILEECTNLYSQLEKHIQTDVNFQTRKKKIDQTMKVVKLQMKNDNSTIFFNSLNGIKKSGPESDFDSLMSQAESRKDSKKINKQNQNLSKFYEQKRAENQKRLKFLTKKEKQLKVFFDKLKVQKNGNVLNIKLIENGISKQFKPVQTEVNDELKNVQTNFEDKKKKLNILYQDGQIDTIIKDFVQEWITPEQKLRSKIKNIESINKFIISLQSQDRQQKQPKINIFTASKKNINLDNLSRRTSGATAFRIKSNTSRRASDRNMADLLKNHDYFNAYRNSEAKKSDQKLSSKGPKSFKQYLHEADIMLKQKKYEELHQHYMRIYKQFKQEQEKQTLLLRIAENFQNLNFYDEAEKTYIKCTKFNSIQAFFKLGSLQIRTNKIQAGIQSLQKANCIDRHNIKIQIKLVYAYSLLQQTISRALALANSILTRDPQCIEALIMTSKILQKHGKLKQALDIALAIGNNCGSAPTFHYIGLLYLNDSNISQAFRFFHEAIQCQPDHVPSLIQLATIMSESKPNQAIQIFKNVLQIEPKNQLAFARLGKIYETIQNDYENALETYKKGLQYCHSYQNYLKIGDCLQKLGSIPEAYLNFREALQIKKTPQVYQKIAQIHQIQHQQKKAIQAYNTALALLPKDNHFYSKRKKYLYKLGKLSLANQDFETAHIHLSEVADMQQNFEVFKMLGQACYGKADYNEALRYYEQAVALQNQDNLELLENIAMCFDKLEDYQTSKQIYQKILSLDPKNIRCLNNLANIFLILGKTNEAFYWFEFMLQQAPTNIEKRLRVVDIYATIGDWSKVEQHLLVCHKQKQNDIRVLQRMVNLYKQKRDAKQLNKFEKRLALIKNNSNKNG